MASSLRPVRLSCLLVLFAALAAAASAQQPAAEGVPSVRLDAHNGKTSFYLGEPIPLDLVFENRTDAPFTVNNTVYGDLSEKVEITPAEGWFQWQTQSGHDYADAVKLGATPERIPVRLDEGFIFREPGEYRVRVTTARLTRGSMLSGTALPAITTNDVTITLRTMPPEVEKATLTTIRADLASAGETRSGYELRQSAMDRLAALQGDDALAEKIRLLGSGDEEFRQVLREAFATTHDLHKQLVLLEQAWRDPKLTPQYDTPSALNETRLLLAGRSLAGWQMMVAPKTPDVTAQQLADQTHADMTALLDSMPQRSGESRTMGAYFLVEFGGLSDAERARAVNYAVEEFPHMDDTAQHMLLETARPPLRDPRLEPMLRTMLAANPADKDVVAALLAMVPDGSAAWIVKSVCAPKGVVLLDTFKDAPADRIPAVDACLAPLLRLPPGEPRYEFEWKQRATEAARFATPAILPALHEGWKSPRQDSAVLAVLIRNDPAGAIPLLDREAASGKLDGMSFFETAEVYKQLRQPFPAEVLTWLRLKLKSGTDKEAGIAAYALSIGGETSDAARVQHRLQRLRSRKQGTDQASDVRQAELEFAGALGSYGTPTFVDEAQRRQLGQGCMSDGCRQYLH